MSMAHSLTGIDHGHFQAGESTTYVTVI
jgi:hypothetical protein